MLTAEEVQISKDPLVLLKKAALGDMDFIKDLFYTEMDSIVNVAWGGRFRWESWFKDVTEALELESHNVLLILVSDQRIGFLWMNKELRTLWITAIVLKYEWQRRNIGNQIMTHLIDECRKDGISAIELGVQKNNRAALNFYTELGFRKFDQVRSAGTDLLRLELNDQKHLSYQ
ncbi:MAG: N-acetyltransferase family protein [Candidatus Hodarchaeales archaeon]|jgi:ribosomal protein S18 acetylase RimI-like enzyme